MDFTLIIQKKNKKTKLIKIVEKIDENIKKYASRAENIYGSGGMKTKIDAAKICQLSGCYMVIANGVNKNPIRPKYGYHATKNPSLDGLRIMHVPGRV